MELPYLLFHGLVTSQPDISFKIVELWQAKTQHCCE